MRSFRLILILLVASTVLLTVSAVSLHAQTGTEDELTSVINVQKYNRAIHVMAMLIVGFGFLMVFVKRYGRSALTATYLLVSVAIPLYFLKDSLGIFGESSITIDRLIQAEFAAAALLICAGAALGRLKMPQYMILAIFFVPSYALNEWILIKGGFGLIPLDSFKDTGGSVLIHAFGAFFGLTVVMTMTTKAEYEKPIETDATSDRFSMLGSMVLWLFWPSFCAALVAPELVPYAATNVVLALCGATIATYFASLILRHKLSIGDIANATIAGGVAIGSTCDHASHPAAFVIGILAGVLCVFGFAIIQSRLESLVKGIDTCGVTNLHGFPGLMGGIAAVFVIDGISKASQFAGIGITIVLALITGYITGKILSIFGRRTEPYVDSEEFEAA